MTSISADWKNATLGDICSLKYGKALPQSTRSGGDFPVYGSNGVVGHHDAAITSGRTIVIGRKGSYGEVNFSAGPCWPIDTAYFVDESSTEQDIKWLSYRLAGLGLNQLNKAAAVPGLNREDAYRQPLLVPPLAEQCRIAAILDQADALRVKRREALAQLDSLTQSIFIDMFGDPVSNPRGWNQENLEHFFQFRTGKLDSNAAVVNGAYPFFTCAKEDSQIDTFAFDCEALLLAGNNATADYSVKHYKGKFNAYQRTYVITLKNPDNSYQYAAFFLENHLLELKRMSKGSGTKYLTLAMLNRIRIPVPPVDLQHQFVTRLAELHRIREMFKKSLFDLDTLFASLQYRAFRGEL